MGNLIRMSCVGLAKIVTPDGRFLVLVNHGRMKHAGRRVLSPVGGGLTATPAGMSYLSGLGAHSFEGNGADLRFVIDNDYSDPVAEWFRQRDPLQREINTFREIVEELTQEHPFLTARDLTEMGCYLNIRQDTHDFVGMAVRPGPVQLTRYLMEGYRVTLSETAMDKLVAAAATSDQLYFVSMEEILNGRTADGTEVGSLCQRIFLT